MKMVVDADVAFCFVIKIKMSLEPMSGSYIYASKSMIKNA